MWINQTKSKLGLSFVLFVLSSMFLSCKLYKGLPDRSTMFMTYDFPGVFTIFTSIKLFIAYPYFALMESSRWQGTLGQLAFGIKVTEMNGERISFGRATGRYFLKGVSSFEFMLGYLISFSDQRQTWHDCLAKTLVVRRGITLSSPVACCV